jgi:hypothetical protein
MKRAAVALLWSTAGFGLALGLALGAAHSYQVPKLAGYEPSIWTETDFQCSLASSIVALGVASRSRRVATSAGAVAARSLFLRAVIWAALTLLFLAVWVTQLGLLTLLIAPTHALAGARLVALFGKWRSDSRFDRAR